MAGAAFCPSPPMGKRCMARRAEELVVDTVDSAGLPGRSIVWGRSGCALGTDSPAAAAVVSMESGWGTGLLVSREPGTVRLVWEPLISASRLRRSSNGAPADEGPWSILSVRWVLGVPGDRTVNSEFRRWRGGRGSDSGVRRNTVWGTTPSFCSSIVDVTLSASDSTSTLTREAKLRHEVRQLARPQLCPPTRRRVSGSLPLCKCLPRYRASKLEEIVPHRHQLSLLGRIHAQLLELRYLCLVPVSCQGHS